MKNRKGFTLAELLIVMAIIVVLAAVAVPTFGKQLETSRETGDMEIIRNAYTLAYTAALQEGRDGLFSNVGASGGITITAGTTSGSEGQDATVAVEIGTAIPGAKFSQHGTDADGTGSTWQYVNAKLMGLDVPAVCSDTTTLTFKFAFSSETGTVGEVVPVKTNTTGSTNDLFTAS